MISLNFDFFKKFIYLFICGCIGSSLLHVGFLQLRRAGATLRCGARASHCGGFSCCGTRALDARASVVVACGLQQLWLAGYRAQAQQLWRTGLVAPRHVGSSQTRARTQPPALTGGFLTTAPPGKPLNFDFTIMIASENTLHFYNPKYYCSFHGKINHILRNNRKTYLINYQLNDDIITIYILAQNLFSSKFSIMIL